MRREGKLAALLAVVVVACGTTEVLHNGGFDLWCGEDLCSWEVEAGAVEKAPTWHEQEYGVELVGEPTILSQVLALSSSGEPKCMELALTHQGGPHDLLEVTLDLLDDGTDELVWDVPPSRYDRKTLHFLLPSWFETPRLRLTKHEGRVVLGSAALTPGDDDRCADHVVELLDRPAGAPCDGPRDCSGGACALSVVGKATGILWDFREEVCAECSGDSDCAPSEVCGASVDPDPRFEVPRACVEPGERALGEMCAVDGECATGVCCDGLCAECCGDSACADGAVCDWRSADPEAAVGPRMCEDGLRPAGTACLLDDDCASGTCDRPEELWVCDIDGRRCEADEDCRQTPLGALYEADCVRVGALDGTCG